ncbi:hypothetical protein [Thermosipho atlanticus]|uniref:Uncharacterized protein n=1 Tax=Thermosipho atlanticus DSM 15807 TaxID=1123380 RepID=A0A1M5RWU8_9BACT|nr:hypothetical protein [Thermosipho atlanticus]SHH30508.1 hypothetical protein SAMN02745199_0657 [Thermosipho atlanticus DSM 15807]
MRKKRKSRAGLWISIVVLTIVVISGFTFWKIYSIKSSPEFNASIISQYLFIDSTNNVGYYIFIQGEKRNLYILKVKDHSYNSASKQEIDFKSPLLAKSLLADMLGVNAVYDYYVIFDNTVEDFSNAFGINTNNFDTLFEKLSQRGLKFFDYFKLDGIIKKLRPNTTLTSPALAKLLYAFGNYSVKTFDLPTMTEKPLKITVSGKTFERLYIDLEKLEQLKKLLGGEL